MEKRIYLTVDLECHDIQHRNQYIDGYCKNGIWGLKKILELGRELDIPINFFFDIVEGIEYGDDYCEEIIQLIKSYNQNIYLHLHPDYVSHNHDKSFLWQYTYEEKKEIIKKGFDYYQHFFNHKPEAFRVGRYGADAEMYKAMDALGINTLDLSYCYQSGKMCHIDASEISTRNAYTIYNGQRVFPNTRYLAFDFFGKQKTINVDTNDTTIDELIQFLKKNSLSQITCTMHSWNFIKKYFFSKNYTAGDKAAEKKFRKMVALFKYHGFIFSDLKENPPIVLDEPDEVIDLCSGVSGKIRMIFNNYLRFKKIARLNKKYFIIYNAAYLLCALTVILLLVLLFM